MNITNRYDFIKNHCKVIIYFHFSCICPLKLIILFNSYLVINKKQSLANSTYEKVSTENTGTEISKEAEDIEGFNKYIESYKIRITVEKVAVKYKK